MLSGILYPSSGNVNVLGYTPRERKKEFLKQYALVMGQKSQLWWDLPPLEGFLLNKEIYEIGDKQYKEAVENLAEILGVEKVLKVPVRKLSLGQRMKCELMAALLHQPKILFLDEPTIGLDVVVQKKIRAFLKQYNQERGTTLILTSHYMDDVQELCKRIIVINSGEIVYDGSLRQLMEKYGKNKTLRLVFNDSVKKADLAKFGEIVDFPKGGLAATLSVPRVTHAMVAGKILNTLPVDDLDIAETSLEDIIRDIFEKGK
jgi:ABC-2 type transport system ATP-binding protein